MRRAKTGLGGVLLGPHSVLLGPGNSIVFFAAVARGQRREAKAFPRPPECQEKLAERAARDRFSAKRLLNLHKVCNFVPQFKIFKRRNK